MIVVAGFACVPRTYRLQVVARPVTEWSVDHPVTAIAVVPEGWLTLAEANGWIALWPSNVADQADLWRVFRQGMRILFGPVSLRTWPVRPLWTAQIPDASIRLNWAILPEGLVAVARKRARLWRIALNRHGSSPLPLPEGHIGRYGDRLWWWRAASDVFRFCAIEWTGVAEDCWTVDRSHLHDTVITWTWAPPWWCGVEAEPRRKSRIRIQCIRGVRASTGRVRAQEMRAWTPSRPQGDPLTARCWFVEKVLVCAIGDSIHVWHVETRRPRWRLRVGAGVDVPPVIVPMRSPLLVVATRGMLVYGLDLRNGNRVWVTPLSAPVLHMQVIPAGADDPKALAVVLVDAPPVILSARTGSVAWRASGWRALSVAATPEGTVMWGTDDRQIRLMQVQLQVQLRSGPISVRSQR